jgi:hypothetical protein
MVATRPPLGRAFGAQQHALLEQLKAAVESAYDVDLDDIDASFPPALARIAEVVEAGQLAGQELVDAYLELLLVDAGRRSLPTDAFADRPAAGVTRDGLPLAAGLAAIPALVKVHIAAGRTVDEARELGRYLATRFADAEVTAAMDETTVRVGRGSRLFRAWYGVVAAGACDPCRDNAGEHPIDQPMYRHGHCRCVMEWIPA